MKSILSTVLLLFCGIVPSAFSQECIEPRRIIVTGTAEVNVTPDEVVLDLGVETLDKDLSVAKSQHDDRVKKIIAEVRGAGVEAKDIQTNQLRMSAEYSREKVSHFLGYEMTQTIEVTLKDLSKYEGLMSKLLIDGVNRIHSVEFQVADSRKYKDEARLKAIRAAREKATAMAAELGQSIGKPWTIVENTGNDNYLANANNSRSYGNSGGGEDEGDSTVAPGEVRLRASVTVTFELQ